MLSRTRAYSLIELLAVTVIVSVLAALLFPVFQSAVAASKARVCASNFHQVGIATGLYIADYDDRLMPVSDNPNGPANSRDDHTWVQFVLPYTRNFAVFHCPSDNSRRVVDESTFDQDLVPGDTYSEYFTASMHVNTGYNYQYLSPILLEANNKWVSMPLSESEVADANKTLMFVDSVWALSNGGPTGGGSWLVVPPCRYLPVSKGTALDTFVPASAKDAYIYSPGWNTSNPSSLNQFGGAWPWHAGRMTTISVEGTIRSMTPSGLSAGCDVQPSWNGPINDPNSYLWVAR